MADVATFPALSGLPSSLKPILLLIGIAAAVAAGVTVVLWSRGPSYSLLYANLAPEDQAQVVQALETAQIPHRLQPGSNGIEVPAERVSDARLKLAGQGLPESGGGFAVMEKQPAFGVSQFMENARYQHALETELARTIANLRPVEAARVHLAVPRQSAFVRDRRPASASVFVQLKPGRRLEQGQVQAVVNLVASSIPELEPGQVTVVDQQGRLLSAPEGHDELAIREKQFDMVRRLEEDYSQRIDALLTPLVGPGRVRAQVVAQMDMAVTEEAREQYHPESQIVRSEQLSEQTSRDGSGTQGVPGSLTNQPPTAGAALPAGSGNVNATNTTAVRNGSTPGTAAGANSATGNAGAAAAQAAAGAFTGPDSTSRQTTRNYEIDRTLAYTRQPAGRLKRLTVAVLVDNLKTPSKDGKTKDVPLTAQQLEHITQLVKDAVGYDEARGDSVNVVNALFTQEAPTPDGELQAPAFWEMPLFRDLAKIVAGAVVLLVLVLSVLRPMVRSLIGPGLASVTVLPRAAKGAEGAAAPTDTPLVESQKEVVEAPITQEQQLVNARTLVGQDPKRVAQVVRSWVAEDD